MFNDTPGQNINRLLGVRQMVWLKKNGSLTLKKKKKKEEKATISIKISNLFVCLSYTWKNYNYNYIAMDIW